MAKKAKWRRHTVEFKRQVVERMKTCQNIHELARELKIERKLLYTWKYQFEARPIIAGLQAGPSARATLCRTQQNPRSPAGCRSVARRSAAFWLNYFYEN